MLYPLLLEPALHTKVWGGRKLADQLGKALPTDDPYGETWEVHDTSTVRNGALAGRTLGALLAEHGADLIGTASDPSEGFPLLAKILDANDWLSVQVHPNDEQAAELEGQPRGKTEAWVVIGADPGAKLVVGVKPGTSRAAMADAIRDGNMEDVLVFAEAKKGDVLMMHANTVHALGPGLLIYEIQQSSNTTYRLYDWNRMGLDGKPRELHIEKGVQVSNVDSVPTIDHPEGETVVGCTFFATTRHTATHELNTHGDRFHALTCIEGAARVVAGETVVDLALGETVLVPASVGAYTLAVHDGEVLRSYQP